MGLFGCGRLGRDSRVGCGIARLGAAGMAGLFSEWSGGSGIKGSVRQVRHGGIPVG